MKSATLELPLFDICRNRHQGNAESVAANEVAEPHKEAMRWRILQAIRDAGARGLTLDELAVILDVTPNQISGRVTQLKIDGLIRVIGTRPTRTGSPAAVYVAA